MPMNLQRITVKFRCCRNLIHRLENYQDLGLLFPSSRLHIAQIRGTPAPSCHSSARHATRIARSSSIAASTCGANTRTTTTCGLGLVAPALAQCL